MICPNCGKEVKVVARECPFCYKRLYNQNMYQKKDENKQEEKKDYKELVFASVIPIYGLYKYFLTGNDHPVRKGTYLEGYLIHIILLLFLITIIILGKIA